MLNVCHGKVDYKGMINIELCFLSIESIFITTNDRKLPNKIKKIYPYLKINNNTELVNNENIITIINTLDKYNFFYKNYAYDNLNLNGLYYVIYEIIQEIIENYILLHDMNVLHGACVEKNGKAYIFSAKSNTGKSTLVAELTNRKYNYISDDYVILNKDNTKIIPLHIPIKLRSLEPVNSDIKSQIIVRDYNPIKIENYYLIKPFCYSKVKPFMLQAIFQINRNTDINSIESLDYKDSYKTIIVNSKIPRIKSIKNLNIIALSLVKKIDVYHINYTETEKCVNYINTITDKYDK